MIEFVEALLAPHNHFLRLAFTAALAASVACGVVGSYVVSRRITYLAGGIAHCVLGGVGAAGYLRTVYGLSWLEPLHGALAAGLAAALLLGTVSLHAGEREDTVISALWVVGMSVGILFIYATPGYTVDPMSYLFGNILMLSARDVWLIVGLDALVILVAAAFYRQLMAVCFDPEFARIRGLHVNFYYLLLLCLTALTVVSLMSVVGIVLVIALLALPAASASRFSGTLWHMMALSVVLCALFTTGGLALSYSTNLPSGATIVTLAGAIYLLLVGGSQVRNRLAG